ncbi:MAG: M20/M25/M40 family metallo-hydrolase, partial [Acidobacteriota bacterium]|nr:M20/M25/M40 family metallo-hydrolase [Acidobacteriota bacterium]
MPDNALIDSPVVELATALIACDSTNPDLSPGGVGEAAVAALIAARLRAAGLEVALEEVVPGRPNVIGRLRGSGGGRTLMLWGHMDVVGAGPDGFTPRIEDGRLYGRGAVDMKGGLACAIAAAERLAAGEPLAGDVIVAGVIDEEWISLGAEALVQRHHADGAILTEQSDLDLVVEHGGFAWFELVSRGVESAGIEPDRGVDAIALLAPVLAGITELDADLATRPAPAYGRPSIHASTIRGGTQFPQYPSACTLGIERCLVAGETVAQAQAEIEALSRRAGAADPRFGASVELVVGREPVKLDAGGPLVQLLAAAIERHRGAAPRHIGDIGWADSGLLAEAGTPCVIFGPTGDGHHTAHEYVELESLAACVEIIEAATRAY